MIRVLLKWAICVAALFLAEQIFSGQVHSDTLASLLATGTVLWLVNVCIRPIVKVLSLPITIVTLGLFSLVINALMVKLAAGLVPGMRVDGFLVCVFISIVVSLMNVILIRKKRSHD